MSTSSATNRLRDRVSLPPGGEFFYPHPETGDMVRAPSMHALLALLPSGVSEEEVEHFMCERLPAGTCWRPGKRPRLLLSQVVSFSEFLLRSVVSRLRSEPVLVSEDEARARSEICVSCPFNDKAYCVSCLGLANLSLRALGRRVERDRELGACAKCGCMLQAKVHVALPVLQPLVSSRAPEYPEHCWMHAPKDVNATDR